jgi:hypothetical protein
MCRVQAVPYPAQSVSRCVALDTWANNCPPGAKGQSHFRCHENRDSPPNRTPSKPLTVRRVTPRVGVFDFSYKKKLESWGNFADYT